MAAPKLNESLIKKLTDGDVVKRVLSGEKELFEILMRRHNQKLYRIIRGYIIREEEVMDVMQETYLKAYNKLETFRLDALFSTWLIRIAINEALQWIRKNKKTIAMEDNNIKLLHDNNILSTNFVTPETKIINADLNILITNSIDSIPETYRVVFIMSEVENMSQIEISQSLNISVSNVKVRLHRAKNLIKEEMFKSANTRSILEFGNAKCDGLVNTVMENI